MNNHVHFRIGRTGRAGASGEAHTFFTSADGKHAAELVKVRPGFVFSGVKAPDMCVNSRLLPARQQLHADKCISHFDQIMREAKQEVPSGLEAMSRGGGGYGSRGGGGGGNKWRGGGGGQKSWGKKW